MRQGIFDNSWKNFMGMSVELFGICIASYQIFMLRFSVLEVRCCLGFSGLNLKKR